MSESYDSNIFRTTRSGVPRGRQHWDFVTTAAAIVDVEDKSRLADSLFRAGVNGNAFAYNTDRAFVSGSLFATSDMTRGVSELVRDLRLRISDSFRYTPESPAFLTGGHPADTADLYTRGVQGYRANTYSNTLSAYSGYTLSRSFSLNTNYSYSIFRTGRIDATVAGSNPVSYFNNTQHSADIGPTYTFDGGDTLFFKFNHTTGETKPEGPGATRNYVFQSIAPEYVAKTVVPGWTLTFSAGASRVEQAGRGRSRIYMSGKLGFATDYDPRTHVAMSVSRQAIPSFFGTGSSLISNVARFTVRYDFSRLVQLTAGVNYAYNEAVPVKTFAFRTVGGIAALDYSLTQSTTVSLSQEYTYYERTGVLPYDRIITMLTLKTEWK
jgi:hypothetical protein